jgi:hypothetical protein
MPHGSASRAKRPGRLTRRCLPEPGAVHEELAVRAGCTPPRFELNTASAGGAVGGIDDDGIVGRVARDRRKPSGRDSGSDSICNSPLVLPAALALDTR